ncbi:MAG: hypothetical protein RQ839_09200 [Thermoproteus sp.]|jgi:hypothetical protein|nr:hypothetical protein [Thermoproteus sp.]MDT7882861.1 hypothetical protein [Thermoproteus sp.]
MQYTVQFTNVNDPYIRYLIVCADKQWGQSGCQPWTGDWVSEDAPIGGTDTSPPISASQTVTAVTSSDAGYYYSVKILDSNGNTVKECQQVDRNHPCVYSISPTPAPSPTHAPTIPAPTIPGPAGLSWETIALIGAGMALGGTAIALAWRKRR